MPYDIAIIGGGPAGLSAAINAKARNQTVLVVSNDYRESPLYKAEWVDNYLGMPDLTGPQLLDAYHAHAVKAGVELRTGRVLNIMPMGSTNYISIGSDMVEAKAVIVASGISRGAKYLGETEFLGRGVSYCATCDGMLYRGKEVVVVGLAPDATEEATFLQKLGAKVTFVAPKQPAHLDEAIPFVRMAKLEILGEQMVTGLKVGDQVLACDGVFLLRHAVAPTDLLPTMTLEGGYIQVNRSMETNLPGVFACGDCTGLPLQVSKAVGEGLIAGQKAADYVDQLKK